MNSHGTLRKLILLLPLFLHPLSLLEGPGLAQEVQAGPASPEEDTALLHQMDDFLKEVYSPQGPGAAVAVMKEGKIIFTGGYGLADMESGEQVIPGTVFALGSMTKPITALGILTLAQEGKLELDDPITRFFPDYPEPSVPITLRHLLSHTSGVANYTETPAFRGRIREDFSRPELLALIREGDPDFAPGTSWKYSNSGYALLAMVIEEVTGQPFGEFLRDRFFRPLEMASTEDGSLGLPVPGQAQGYEVRNGSLQRARPMSLSHTLGSGSLFSTVEDLAQWHSELAAGHLLSSEFMGQYLNPVRLESGEITEYSLGWFFGRLQGSPMLSHGGGIFGFVGHMVWLPRERVFVALLTNCTDPSANPATHLVAERVAAMAMGRPIEAQERVAVEVEPELLERLVGSYEIRSPTGGTALRMILLEEGTLYYAYENGPRVRIIPESPTSFFAEGAAAHLTFELNEAGEVTAMVVHTGGGQEIRGLRLPGQRAPQGSRPEPPTLPEEATEIHDIHQGALQALRQGVQSWVEEDRLVGGELLVIQNRRTVLHEAFGWRDKEAEERMEPNTLFNIRSMTKPLVGTAVQLLMEEGRLAPNDRVAKYLPAFDTEAAGEISIEQLLTHRSGLPASVAWNPESPPSSLRAHAQAIAETGPELEPGSRFWYSDAGADVLAALVEAASGESLETFVEARLFDPLGMEDTGFLSRASQKDLPLNRVASLYGGTTGSWQRFWQSGDEPFYPFPMGSQSVYSTPMDYARFLGMWMEGGVSGEGRLLPEAAVRRILTPLEAMTQIGSTVPSPTGFPEQEVWHGEMAMLWREAEEADGPASGAIRAFGYSGSDGTFAWGWPEESLMVLFFTQSRGQNIHLELESLLHGLVTGGEDPAPIPTAHPSPGPAAEPVPEAFLPYLGRYQADSGPQQGTEFTVLFQDGALAVDIPGQTVFALNEPDEDGWRSFVLTDQVAVRFQEDPSGRVEAMELAQTSVFPRGAASNEAPAGTPEDLVPLLGEYLLPGGQGVLEVCYEAESLSVRDPNGRIIPLSAGESPGVWLTQDTPPRPFTFPADPQGHTMAMTLREVVVLPKVDAVQSPGETEERKEP